jgi:predicted protein tyrosine phosphatase
MMEYKSLDQIEREADVRSGVTQAPALSRRERLVRWAEALDRQQGRYLRSIDGTEFGTRRERHSKRADDSPLTVAFADPVLRAEGLRGDRVGDAVDFFGLSEHDVHRLVCYCHYGRAISAAVAADHVRAIARHADAFTLPRARTVIAGASALAALLLAAAVL